ncbi:MAG: ATP-binding protein [Acidobacteriota bacterium]
MLRSRFFWKLYAGYAALVLATTMIIGILVQQQLQASMMADVEAGLRSMAALAAPHATEAFRRQIAVDIQQQIERLGRETNTRFTLVLPGGEVLADSDENPQVMENHADRPEIVAALSQPYGVSRRFSRTLQQSLLYVALAVRDGDELLGVVRVSIPLADLQARLASLRKTILVGAAAGIIVALALGLVVARRITAPLAEMTEVAEALGGGAYGRRVRVHKRDEIGTLGDTLNRLADELTRRIATLANERAQLGAMLAGMQEGVVGVDHEDRIVFSNAAGRRLLNLGENSDGRKLWEMTRVPGLTELLSAAHHSHAAAREEIRLHGGSEETVLDARATPFETEEEEGIVLVLYDITNLRRLERIRTDFVANVSHDLKTPLTSIQGYVETLLAGALHDDDHNVRFLGKIDHQVTRLGNLVSDLLSLARIESPAEILELTEVAWPPLIEVALQQHRESMERKELNCTVPPPTAAVTVRGNRAAMAQILDNLLENAINYTPAGGTISIRTFVDSDRGGLLIEDTGCGIPADSLDRIFERFYRADSARSREVGGTGLGLAIVKHLVQKMGGQVHVESELGKGSRFTVLLPLAS